MTCWCKICKKKYDTKDERVACEKSHMGKILFEVGGHGVTCYDVRSFDDYVKILEFVILSPKDEFICRDVYHIDRYAVFYGRINTKYGAEDIWLYLKPEKGKRKKKNN